MRRYSLSTIILIVLLVIILIWLLHRATQQHA